MKQAIRLLSRFILSTLLLLLVFASLVVLSRYVTGFDPDRASPDTLVTQFLDAVRDVAIIAIVVAAAVVPFATIRTTDKPFFLLILLSVSWTLLLVLATILWPGGTAQPLHVTLPEEQVVRISGTDLFALEIEGANASPVVFHRAGIRPGTELVEQAIIDPDRGTVRVPGRDDLTLQLDEIESSYPSMVDPPERVFPLIRDIRALNALLVETDDGQQSSALLLSVAIGLFLLSCWTLARMTRWPLFNAVLVFLIIRAALWFLSSLHFGELGALLSGTISPDSFDLVAAGALGFVALVLALLLFFLPPLSEWKRELVHE